MASAPACSSSCTAAVAKSARPGRAATTTAACTGGEPSAAEEVEAPACSSSLAASRWPAAHQGSQRCQCSQLVYDACLAVLHAQLRVHNSPCCQVESASGGKRRTVDDGQVQRRAVVVVLVIDAQRVRARPQHLQLHATELIKGQIKLHKQE